MAAAPTQPLRADWKTREVGSLVSQAKDQLTRLERELVELDSLEQQAAELRATLLPWADLTDKQPLERLQRELPEQAKVVELQVENVVSLLGQALELDPDNITARGKLADLYWLLFSRAEQRGETAAMERNLALLALHDDGRYADLVEGTGTIQVETEPASAQVLLHGEEGAVDLGCTPLGPLDIAPGSYTLEIRPSAGHAPALRPIQVHRGADLQIRVRLFATREVGPDYRYIPAGRFQYGGDNDAPGAGPARSTFVDNVAVARYPVTVGEYMLFLDELSSNDAGLALTYSPLPTLADRRTSDPRLPVTGISLPAARAYCEWLSARTGIPHRLPTEVEWEKAARGVDGRVYPWGDRFDPSLCRMRRSFPGAPCKGKVGSVSSDVSDYGVHDLAGGVHEWTNSTFDADSELQVVRGGAFDDGADTSRCAARIPTTSEAQISIGFRLVRPLARGGGDQINPAPVPSLPGDLEPTPDPVTSPVTPVKEALARVLEMSRRLAAAKDDPAQLLAQLLAETVELLHAERGFLLRRSGEQHMKVVEARTAHGEPIPPSDRGFDLELASAALKQQRSITLADSHPTLVVPLPDGQCCLLLDRRFHRDARFGDDGELVAAAAADPLALAIRLSAR